MKIQIASDLHLELRSKTKFQIRDDAETLVLAGDVHKKPKSLAKFFRRILKQNDIPIVYILGNHEYYGRVFPDALDEYREACADIPQVKLLEKKMVEIKGVQFLGTTLWSDISNPLHALAVQAGITDFKYDHGESRPVVQVRGTYDGMSPFVWTREYMECREWLVEALENRNPRKPTVVVTHHAPTRAVHPKKFLKSLTRAAYESELSGLMDRYKPELWVYGHDHGPRVDTQIYETRVVCNQMGYYFEKAKQTKYEPWIIEVK
ncbi:MAG: hypothetical protein DRP83_00225 [Planctomycetota bacterium]|nr:MAG: hypothetical protein DRP83_00225 [Planctomycetota bacterium]